MLSIALEERKLLKNMKRNVNVLVSSIESYREANQPQCNLQPVGDVVVESVGVVSR